MKFGQKSIGPNPIHSVSIQGLNKNKSEPRFQSEWIRGRNGSDSFELNFFSLTVFLKTLKHIRHSRELICPSKVLVLHASFHALDNTCNTFIFSFCIRPRCWHVALKIKIVPLSMRMNVLGLWDGTLIEYWYLTFFLK